MEDVNDMTQTFSMKEFLNEMIRTKGKKQVAYELGVSLSTLVLYLHGKYPSHKKIEERIKKIYGPEGIHCPILGLISPAECARAYELARKVGILVSNPQKLRLYKECLKCKIRK